MPRMRTRQAVNSEVGITSPTKTSGETPSSRSTRSRRFQTPENLGSSSSGSPRSSHASDQSSIPNGRDLADDAFDPEDDSGTIYVRPRITDRTNSQDSPRKRRKTTQGVLRVPGSPSAQLVQIESTPPARASRRSVDDAEDANSPPVDPKELENPIPDAELDPSGVAQGQGDSNSAKDEDIPALKSEEVDQGGHSAHLLGSEADNDSYSLLSAFHEVTSIEKAQSTVSEDPRKPSPSSSIASNAQNDNVEPSTPSDPNELTETDLPPPFLVRSSTPSESSFSDLAAYILASKYAPLPDPQDIITALTKHAPTARSTETLYALAQNTHRALRAWQDEYLTIDKKTAPISNPPKKAATGGREPQESAQFEASKESTLYSGHHSHDQGGHGSASNGDIATTGRELRRRRDAGIVDGLNISDDDAGAGTDRGKSKRSRRPVRRFDGSRLGTATPEQSGPGGVGTRRRRMAAGGDAENGRRRRGRVSALARSDDFLSPTPEGSDAAGDDHMYGVRRRRGPRGGGNSAAGTKRRKQKVKSEKRSESMTAWWAERKRKAAEQKIKELRDRGVFETKEADELGAPAAGFDAVNHSFRGGPGTL